MAYVSSPLSFIISPAFSLLIVTIETHTTVFNTTIIANQFN